MRVITSIILTTIWFTGFGQDSFQMPRELELIFEYAQKNDYPEVFKNNPYQLRPVDWQIIDIDNDGVTEVFLQVYTHYRQSPTITIYQIDSIDTVTRITEGLAPGSLIPLNPEDDYLDSHTTGTAIDMQLDNLEMKKMRAFAKSSLKFGMSTVIYKNFLHTDKRDGKPIFLDLSHLDYKNENNCENFQFSKPTSIVAGSVNEKKEKYFFALVSDEIYCYAIKGFTTDSWIDKELTIIKKPKNFKTFIIDNGQVKYLTLKNKKKNLKI